MPQKQKPKKTRLMVKKGAKEVDAGEGNCKNRLRAAFLVNGAGEGNSLAALAATSSFFLSFALGVIPPRVVE